LSDDARISGLVRQLGSKDWEAASEAQRTLVRVGRPAVPQLCEVLEGADLSVAWRAAWVLGRIWDRRAVVPLCRVLRIGYSHAPYLPVSQSSAGRTAARDQHALLRVEVTDALRLLRDPASIGPLCEALEDGYFNVRKNAAKALSEIGPPAAPQLAACVTRLPLDSTIQVIVLLGRMGDEHAIPPLCELLSRSQFPVRLAAVKALGSVAERCHAPELRAAIPELKRMASLWRPVPDELQDCSLVTLRRIETATAALQSVPRPAGAPTSGTENLPRPAGLGVLRSSPLTGAGEEPHADPTGSPLLRKLRALLRGGD
jgi:HEAT repeat protein